SEFFTAWYSENSFERAAYMYRAVGPYRGLFWTMLACNCVVPLLALLRLVRRNLAALFMVSVLVNVGMYLERFIIVPVTLTHDFDPYIWRLYRPTLYEYGILAASVGFFFFCFLLFIKFVPPVPVYEVKQIMMEMPVPFEKETQQ